MLRKIKSFLFLVDFMGLYPNLRVLNNDNYKSTFSSTFSVLIILLSLSFSVYSIIDYLNQNPIISYYKSVDNEVNKTIKLNDTFIMFNITANCPVNFDFLAVYMSNYVDESIKVEPCELGKNLDLKYKDLIENIENVEDVSLNDYTCLNLNNNLTLFQNNIDSDSLMEQLTLSITITNETDCPFIVYKIQIITENDVINHQNKSNPFIPYYRKDTFINYEPYKILSFRYDYQYTKYESDDGILFQDINNINGIGFSGISYDDNNNLEMYEPEIWISFRVNKANYDLYKRSYKRIQSYLSDITSVANIMIAAGKFLLNYLLDKKMSVDIVENILSKTNFEQKKNYIPKEKIKLDTTIQNIGRNKSEKSNNISKQMSINTTRKLNLNKINSIKNINRVGEKIGYFDIIKSYLSCKNFKTKLLDICYEYILEEFCIDKILKRLYKLESHYNKKIYKKENNFRIQKTLHYIDCINNESNKLSNEKHYKSQIIKSNKQKK